MLRDNTTLLTQSCRASASALGTRSRILQLPYLPLLILPYIRKAGTYFQLALAICGRMGGWKNCTMPDSGVAFVHNGVYGDKVEKPTAN